MTRRRRGCAARRTRQDGSYEVQRPFVFVTNDSVTLSAQLRRFFDFAASTALPTSSAPQALYR